MSAIWGLRSTSFESSCVLYLIPTNSVSLRELRVQGMQQNYNGSVFNAKRTIGGSNRTVFYKLQSRWLSLLIGLDICVPHLWIRPSNLAPINPACRLPQIGMDTLYILGIILTLLTVAKRHSVATPAKLLNMNSWITKTHQLHMWWLLIDYATSFGLEHGGCVFSRPHAAGTPSPSY